MAIMEELNQDIANLSVRLPAHIKERIERAAVVSGLTITDFAISVLADSADEVLERHNTRTLSDRDRDSFLKMIDNPPKPNEALKRAAKRYNESKKRVT
jgi:uncharacterized protein (DUF1778 family)